MAVDEIRDVGRGLDHLRVGTWHNGALHREAGVAGMAFGPEELLAFHNRMFPMPVRTVISTGAPGAVVIEDGDIAECQIEGVGSLTDPVRSVY